MSQIDDILLEHRRFYRYRLELLKEDGLISDLGDGSDQQTKLQLFDLILREVIGGVEPKYAKNKHRYPPISQPNTYRNRLKDKQRQALHKLFGMEEK